MLSEPPSPAIRLRRPTRTRSREPGDFYSLISLHNPIAMADAAPHSRPIAHSRTFGLGLDIDDEWMTEPQSNSTRGRADTARCHAEAPDARLPPPSGKEGGRAKASMTREAIPGRACFAPRTTLRLRTAPRTCAEHGMTPADSGDTPAPVGLWTPIEGRPHTEPRASALTRPTCPHEPTIRPDIRIASTTGGWCVRLARAELIPPPTSRARERNNNSSNKLKL